MRTRSVLIRSLTLCATAAALSVATPAAVAGTYEVRSCSLDPTASSPPALTGADDAWRFDTNDATGHYESIRQCPPADNSGVDGLIVRDKLDTAGVELGRFAQWRFDAPMGTSLAHLRLWWYAGKRVNDWLLYTRDASGTTAPDTDCSRDPDRFTCTIPPLGGLALLDWNVNTFSVQVGFLCTEPGDCATGHGLHEVWTGIYSARVTVDDPTPPTVSGATGSLLADGYVHGTVTAGVTSASDTTGIRKLRVVADSSRTAGESDDRADCDFSRRVPCTSVSAPESFSFDSRNIGDGPHMVQVGATDSALNFTAAGAPRQITVDNTAPAAPTPTSPTSTTVPAPGASISWTDPLGQVAPITTAHLFICGPAGCVGGAQAETGGGGSAIVPLTGGRGRYTVSVSLEDAAGNWVPGVATTWTIDFPPPAQATPTPSPNAVPVPAPAPTVKTSPRLTAARPSVARDRRTVAVHGGVASGVTGRVTVTATARIGGRARTVTRSATIRGRRYGARVRLPSTRWRTATVMIRFPGDRSHRAARLARRVAQRHA